MQPCEQAWSARGGHGLVCMPNLHVLQRSGGLQRPPTQHHLAEQLGAVQLACKGPGSQCTLVCMYVSLLQRSQLNAGSAAAPAATNAAAAAFMLMTIIHCPASSLRHAALTLRSCVQLQLRRRRRRHEERESLACRASGTGCEAVSEAAWDVEGGGHAVVRCYRTYAHTAATGWARITLYY